MKVKPFLRWAGGKSEIVQNVLEAINLTDQWSVTNLLEPHQDEIASAYPPVYFIEPFLGGGAVLLALLKQIDEFCAEPQPEGPAARAQERLRQMHIFASDSNPDLINLWQVIRDDFVKFKDYCRHDRSVSAGPSFFENTADNYYSLRDRFNSPLGSKIERAAWFLFLNRTCFNGLYRVNKQGKFNTPYGHLKTDPFGYNHGSRDCLLTSMAWVSQLLRRYNVTFTSDDFRLTFDRFHREDLRCTIAYVDPPYAPVSKTSFVSYSGKFDDDDQRDLRGALRYLESRGGAWVASNSDCDLTRKLYADSKNVLIPVKRRINSDSAGRGAVMELLARSK